MRRILFFLVLSIFSFPLFAQTYEELLQKSADCLEKKDLYCAEYSLKEALKKEPGNAANTLLLTNLGTIQRDLGKLNEALISYTAALGKTPNAVFLLHNRAALYCEMNDFDNALKDYNSILIAKEDDVEAYYQRGLIYLDQNNIPAAKEDFYKIEELMPDNVLAKLGFAHIYRQSEEWSKAEEIYSDLIYRSKGKPNSKLHFFRAQCYANMDKNARAIEDLNKAVELGMKQEPALYIMRGEIRLSQYDKISAKMDFMKAIELGADKNSLKFLLKRCD